MARPIIGLRVARKRAPWYLAPFRFLLPPRVGLRIIFKNGRLGYISALRNQVYKVKAITGIEFADRISAKYYALYVYRGTLLDLQAWTKNEKILYAKVRETRERGRA